MAFQQSIRVYKPSTAKLNEVVMIFVILTARIGISKLVMQKIWMAIAMVFLAIDFIANSNAHREAL